MMNRAKRILTLKYVIYALILLILYVLQTTPGLFVVFGTKPMLVVPAAIAIAMYEGEFVGGLYGAFAGLLNDMGSSMLFGFNGLFLTFFCIVSGLLIIYLMHCNVRNAALYVAVTMLVTASAEFLFGYGMWGYAGVWRIYVFDTLPLIAYTTAVSPLLFWMVRAIHGKTQKHLAHG